MQPKIVPNLWFDTEAEDAAGFYVSVFKNARILNVARYTEAGPREPGTVMTVEFELDGLPARIESYACSCRGPEKPHEHWFVRVPGLHPGTDVEVVDVGGGRYALRRADGEPLDELP